MAKTDYRVGRAPRRACAVSNVRCVERARRMALALITRIGRSTVRAWSTSTARLSSGRRIARVGRRAYNASSLRVHRLTRLNRKNPLRRHEKTSAP